MNNPKAKYQIEGTFKITGRGIVIAGKIIEGNLNLGDLIEFECKGKPLRRRIKGVEMIRSTNEKINVGILIDCVDDSEIDELREWSPHSTIAKIFSNE